MSKNYDKYNFAGQISQYFKKVERSKWYMAYMQELLLRDLEKKEPDIRRMLNANKELENIHRGKRCFVLGNGPSLNNIDFKRLSKEIVFTVNHLSEHPQFQELQSDYHVLTDLQSFGVRYPKEKLTPGVKEYTLKSIRSLASKGNPILIVPYQAKPVLQKAGITDILRIKYVCPYRSFVDGFHSCNLTKPISSFTGTVLATILYAVYMGVSEIYLLGCEQTGIIDMLECVLGNKSKYGHAYAEREALYDEGYRIWLNSVGIKKLMKDEYSRHEGYDQIYHYCRQRGVQIYNLTVPTLISSIPKRNFEEIIKKGLNRK